MDPKSSVFTKNLNRTDTELKNKMLNWDSTREGGPGLSYRRDGTENRDGGRRQFIENPGTCPQARAGSAIGRSGKK